MKKIIIILIIIPLILNSCYINHQIVHYKFEYNAYQACMGKSKNEILRTIGVPNRSMSDGAGGEVLVYENTTITTQAYQSYVTYGASQSASAAVYGNGSAVGLTYGRYGQVTTGNGTSQTTAHTNYLHLFVDKNGVVYDFRSNTNGDIYSSAVNYERCYSNFWSIYWVVLTAVFPPDLLVTVPLVIIKHHKAKKNGEICKPGHNY